MSVPYSFAHIINPYRAVEGSDAWRIQQVTLRSLADAVGCSRKAAVRLLTAQFEEDRAIVPEGFSSTENLKRSVADLHAFLRPRKFPLIADVLQRAVEGSDAEFVIYTNMDIIVQPYFYDAIAALLADGSDALIINRRRIADHGQTAEDLPLILADVGRSHPGFDCFVMHRSLIPKLRLDGLCIGVPFVEAGLMYNLMAFAADCRILEHLHLTTHLGLEVMPERDTEYHRYNQQCFNALLADVKPMLVGKNLPYGQLGLLERTLKRGLNPAVFTGLHLELEGKTFLQRLRARWNELRFRLLHR
jgi:hypothetical protein